MRNIFRMRNAQPAHTGRSGAVFATWLIVLGNSALGQNSLPVVDGVDCRALRVQCREMLADLAKVNASLPKKTDAELRALLGDGQKDSEETAERIQKLLNAQCLV